MKKNRRKLPTTVDIGGLLFKIKYPISLSEELLKELGKDVVGYCDWKKRELVVVREWAKVDEMTLIHEIVHAIFSSLDPTSKAGKETIVRPFSQMLYGALKSIGMIK